MATKIVTKNSSTASAVPTASDLVQGELAVNVADKRLFTEDNGGAIVELGTNPSTIDINAGTIDGTTIGASSASTGAFTTLTATGLTVDTNTLYVDSTNNRVGIGTSSPAEPLHVQEGSSGITSRAGTVALIEGSGNTKVTVASGATSTGELLFGRSTDNDSGRIVYDHSDNSLASWTNSTERMRIDSSGRVGIGTSSPNESLHVYNAAANVVANFESGDAKAFISFKDNSTTNTDTVFLGADGNNMAFYAGSASAERMRIDSAGNVGVGTTSPSAILQSNAVAPTYTNASTVFFGSTTNNSAHNGIMLSSFGNALGGSVGSNLTYANSDTPSQTNTARSSGEIQFGNTTTGSKTSDIKFGGYVKGSTTYTERLRIDSSGNVGIGTASAVEKLEVAGNILLNASNAEVNLRSGIEGTSGAVNWTFNTNTTNYASIKLPYDSRSTTGLHIDSGYPITLDASGIGTIFSQSGSEKARIDSSGNLLVGQTSVAKPTQSNEILTGAMRVNPTLRTAANAANLYWEPSTGVFWRSTSSLRYKQNVQDYTRGISDLMQMRPVTFNNKVNDTTKLFTGFIAEDLHEQGLEEFVEYDGENRPDSVAYANLTSLLTKAIQEQQATIESQATAITDLTTRLTELENN